MSAIEDVKAAAVELYEGCDSAHDYHHADRVARLALHIQKGVGAGDPFVVEAASYLHDGWAYMGRKGHVGEEAIGQLRFLLKQMMKFPPSRIEGVVEAVKRHEDFNWNSSDDAELSIECQILQDADRLDALGAIGIARCFYTTATLEHPMGAPQDMHAPKEQYEIGLITSAVMHFYAKLLNLKDNMNTARGRAIAAERHAFMEEFLNRYRQEWLGG